MDSDSIVNIGFEKENNVKKMNNNKEFQSNYISSQLQLFHCMILRLEFITTESIKQIRIKTNRSRILKRTKMYIMLMKTKVGKWDKEE